MLDAEGADIADALSRLCVLRMEDAQLLSDMLAHDRAARTVSGVEAPRSYQALVCKEVEGREKWRRQQEASLCERLHNWERRAASTTTAAANSTAEAIRSGSCVEAVCAAWVARHELHAVLLPAVQAAYNLSAADLSVEETPFASLSSCRPLYGGAGAEADPSGQSSSPPLAVAAAAVDRVHRELFGSGGRRAGALDVEALLEEPFTMDGGAPDPRGVCAPVGATDSAQPLLWVSSVEARRQRLRVRRQWQVLLLLWLHVAVLRWGGDMSDTEVRALLGEMWASVPSAAAEQAIGGQRAAMDHLMASALCLE